MKDVKNFEQLCTFYNFKIICTLNNITQLCASLVIIKTHALDLFPWGGQIGKVVPGWRQAVSRVMYVRLYA